MHAAAGIQDWVNEVYGTGVMTDFFQDTTLRTYYKNWLKHIITRTNSITGQRYIDDPTILSWCAALLCAARRAALHFNR